MKKRILAAVLLISLLFTGCGNTASETDKQINVTVEPVETQPTTAVTSEAEPTEPEEQISETEELDSWLAENEEVFDPVTVPTYDGEAYVEVNDNLPFFTEEDLSEESFETYSELDELGRCGTAYANIGQDLMPTEPRGEIGAVRPSGWHTVKYEGIDGNYLYNRCHLIAYQLAGENANEKNLITGTRYLNTQGMLPLENQVADYVKETGNHVLYRVTPIFEGDNLLSSGVLMEGYSVEDGGEGICFCVYAYNVQPDIRIDYATGDSESTLVTPTDKPVQTQEATQTPTQKPTQTPTAAPTAQPTTPAQDQNQSGTNGGGQAAQPTAAPQPEVSEPVTAPTEITPTPTDNPDYNYVLNTNTMKFHVPGCSSVGEMSEKNKWYYSGSRENVIAMGYVPCKRCNP